MLEHLQHDVLTQAGLPVSQGASFGEQEVILTQQEAADLLRMSVRQLQRLDEVGEFAPRIRLSTRRVGYWRRDCLAWAQSRTAPTKHAA